LGQKFANAALWAGALLCNKKKYESRTQLDIPAECASGGDPLLLYKILHLLFSLWYEIFVHYASKVKKNIYQHGLDAGPLEFQFLQLRGCLTNPFRTLSLCFGVKAKHQVSSPVIILLKKFLPASAIAIMSWQDVTRSSLCSSVVWNKMCTQLSVSQILFQNLKNYSLGDVQNFCYHS
jgi:hypothetical protein